MEAPEILSLEGIPAELSEGHLSRHALQALRRIPGVECSPLSPLAHLTPLAGSDNPSGLVAYWEADTPFWEWVLPALLDARRSVTLLLGDLDTSILGQYLWSDANGLMPGVRVEVEAEQLNFAGPLAQESILTGLLEMLQLGALPETEPLRIQLTQSEFWTLLALFDAYRMSMLENRLLRKGGFPRGVSADRLKEVWNLGLTQPNFGWAVSLFSTMLPDNLPTAFPQLLPALLTQMEAQGLLTSLGFADEAETERVFVFSEALEVFFQTLVPSATLFGLVVQAIHTAGQVETSAIGGFRSGSGIWLVDVSDIEHDSLELIFVGPHFAATMLEKLLGDAPENRLPGNFTLNPQFQLSALLSAMMHAENPAAQTSSTTCGHCGIALIPQAHFCPKCGTPAAAAIPEVKPAPASSACPYCGAAGREGMHFCAKCGQPRAK